MNDHQIGFAAQLKTVVNSLAATLGIGSALGIINLFVGIASACWLLVQFYTFFKYDLPLKKARLKDMQDYEFQKTKLFERGAK